MDNVGLFSLSLCATMKYLKDEIQPSLWNEFLDECMAATKFCDLPNEYPLKFPDEYKYLEKVVIVRQFGPVSKLSLEDERLMYDTLKAILNA